VLGVTPVGAEPTGTIGVGGVEVLVESEPDDGVACGGLWPSGTTMGVGLTPPSPWPALPLPESEFSCGGQSTEVGASFRCCLIRTTNREEGSRHGRCWPGATRHTRRAI